MDRLSVADKAWVFIAPKDLEDNPMVEIIQLLGVRGYYPAEVVDMETHYVISFDYDPSVADVRVSQFMAMVKRHSKS